VLDHRVEVGLLEEEGGDHDLGAPAAYAAWSDAAEAAGLMVPGKPLLHGAFSHAHTDADLEALLEATREALLREGSRHA